VHARVPRSRCGRRPGGRGLLVPHAGARPGERHGLPRVQARCRRRTGASERWRARRAREGVRGRALTGALPSCARVPAQEPEAKKARVETAAPATANSAKVATPVKKAAAAPAKKEEKKKEEFSWEKKKPDPKDFMFSNLKGQVGDSAAPPRRPEPQSRGSRQPRLLPPVWRGRGCARGAEHAPRGTCRGRVPRRPCDTDWAAAGETCRQAACRCQH